MVRDPLSLEVEATAQEAGEALSPADVRAVFVWTAGRLAGVVTRKTLVREVVAAGRDPRATRLRDIAEPPLFTIDAGLAVEDAFRLLEEHDLERVPVTEDGPSRRRPLAQRARPPSRLRRGRRAARGVGRRLARGPRKP